MSIKYSIGKLKMPESTRRFEDEPLHQVYVNEIQLLPISQTHIISVASLPLYHRDPFDRMLVIQAIQEHLPLISIDAAMDMYPIRRIWRDEG